MDLLIALKAGSRQFRKLSSHGYDPVQPISCKLPTREQRLALRGAPEPYFVVNPHLFEDTDLWSAESLRKLCSDLGLAASGTRSQLVERLHDFDRNSLATDPKDAEYDDWEEHAGSGNLTFVPISCDEIPKEFRAPLTNSPCARPALRKRRVKCISRRHPPGYCCKSSECPACACNDAAAEKACSSNSPACFARQPCSEVYEKKRGVKRQRSEDNTDPGSTTEPSRKKIKFSPFNNVQLITGSAADFAGKAFQVACLPVFRFEKERSALSSAGVHLCADCSSGPKLAA